MINKENLRIADYCKASKDDICIFYKNFIEFAQEKTNNANMYFGMYCDGEPFLSGVFGQIAYSKFKELNESK